MCCRRRRPPRCWSPGGPTPPSVLAPQPLEHCPGVVRPKSLSLCWINPICSFVLPLSFNRHLWVGDLPFLIFKAKTSETPSQTVCSLAAWLGESETVLGDSGGLVSATTACPFHRLIKEQRGEFLCKALRWTLLSFNVILPELQTDLL